MRAHSWLFDCALDAAFPKAQRFRIQVFDDGTMTGTVEEAPPQSPTPAAHERLLFGKPAAFQFYVLDGHATWRDVDGEEEPRCRCRFRIMRFSHRLREGQLINCWAELLPASHTDSAYGSVLHMASAGLRRCIRSFSQDLQLPAQSSLRLIDQRVTPCITPLVWRLTPGSFTFKGLTCAVSEMLYECKLTLNLAPDGSLSGVSEDVVHNFPRKSKLHGYWTADNVAFQLLDDSGDAAHVFIYSMTPHPSGLRGSWHEQISKKRGYFQQGHVELAVESARRHGAWTPEHHEAYPDEFQLAAHECLNATRAGGRDVLPRDAWESVLAHCSYDWF